MEAQRRPRVVIIGAGFGGLFAARALKRAPVELIVLDRRNHHLFQPLLYQVATAALNPSDIAAPIRQLLRRQRNCTVLLGEARAIDPDAKTVALIDEEISYNHLIVACGATHSYFGHRDWMPLAPGLKSIEDATEIRKRVLFAYEAAEREATCERRREWLTFVVVGGGPTGVELAGALADIANHALHGEFRRFDPRDARVLLVEAGPRVLATYSPALSEKAARQLRKIGVEVREGAAVTGIDAHGVWLAEERINARTVLWGAGVEASPLGGSLGAPLDRAGRVRVTPHLTVPGHDDIYVIGDLALVMRADGRPVPGVAPAAMQEGRYVARALMRRCAGRMVEPFIYRDKGSLATIGRKAAVAELPLRIRLWGFPAWAAWLLVHLFFLIGFRNRVLVLFEWAYAYFTYRRGARLITGPIAEELTSTVPTDDAMRAPAAPVHPAAS